VKRVLVIAYQYPPVGGAGVQRTTKFVKYLPSWGWQPSVLTVSNPSVPVLDKSLGDDLSADVVIRRARTFEPGYALKSKVSAGGAVNAAASDRKSRLAPLKGAARRLVSLALQPDPQVLWVPAAIREGKRLLREIPHDAIYVTAPPFSSFLVGAALSRKSGLPLLIDYRDEWNLSSAYWENKRLDPFSARLQQRMQRKVVRQARAMVATTRMSAAALEAVRDEAGGRASVTCIYNGYDPDDFPASPAPAPASAPAGPYRLAYIGTLWNLASVEPLVRGVRELAARDTQLASRLELVLVGRRTEAQERLLDEIRGGPCRMVSHPYLDHRDAVDLMRSVEGLCVLLSDLPGVQRVVPAKIFECMAARRPILAIAPRGEVWDLLGPYPAATLLTPSDTAGVADALASEIQRHVEGRLPSLNGWKQTGYDRRSQAGQLASVLEEISADNQPSDISKNIHRQGKQ
jgi:hypothetical protein